MLEKKEIKNKKKRKASKILNKMEQKFVTKNLRKRIENIDNYISMSKRLEKIIEEPEILEVVSDLAEILKGQHKIYEYEIELQREEVSKEVRINNSIAKLAIKVYGGNFQKAKESLKDPNSNLKKYFFSYLSYASLSACLCILTSPFSRESSQLHHQTYDSYKRKVKALANSILSDIKTKKNIKKLKREYLMKNADKIREIEFKEAKMAEYLTEVGFDKKSANYIATEQPELFGIFCLENIKEIYGKGIV